MKNRLSICGSAAALLMCAATGNAWHLTGKVQCPGAFALPGVVVNATGTSCEGPFSASAATGPDGSYEIKLPDCDGSFTATLDISTLPAGSSVTSPALGSASFVTTFDDDSEVVDFEIGGIACSQGACWFTGGGAKIDPLIGLPVGQKGKWISFGGNVNPGCSPTAGDGGNWNHVDRLANMHFQGRTIRVIDCGNVTPPPPPGSTSPVTPFNYIEWTGVGTVKGIQGNKLNINVYFNARTEDRNEPGTKDANAGSGVDRYYLHVFTNPADPIGSTLLLVNGHANPLTVIPVEIDHGNFQLHISSCDNPPTL
jgi:hypothetical protein